MVHYELNDELDGIELYFDGIFPNEKLRTDMKKVKLRWNPHKKCWYTKQWNEDGVKFIKDYCAKNVENEISIKKPKVLTFDSIMPERCCYSDLFVNFKNEPEVDFIEKIKSTFFKEHVLNLSDSQINAWEDSYRVMQNINLNPNISIIFEYVLPYESGRRPDVILLSKEQLIILEFKMKNEIKNEDIDQVNAYARDLREYHYESRDKEVIPILVLTKTKNLYEKKDKVIIISNDNLQDVLDKLYSGEINKCDFKKWITSKYEPLPTIVESARNFMKHEDLPNIRRVNSTCIPQTLESLKNLTKYAKENQKHIIAFVTGVPGAGKTYLGLQYVYDVEDVNSVYLSGNGPLVKVLHDALNSTAFVKDLHKVENEFLRYGAYDFNKNVIVFDEGQRAWDVRQMMAKKRGNFSEPDVMIDLCEQRLDWCVLLILVGEGQEIYKGENSGIKIWDEAISHGEKNWEVVCSPKLFSVFKNQYLIDNVDNSSFDLTVSLRSHLSGTVSQFINYVIEGDIEKAHGLSDIIYSEGYNMYCTRKLDAAKSYCKNRYADETDKKYGLIASSKSRVLPKFGINNRYNATSNIDFGKWFNAPSTDLKSCCALKQVVTEFGIQGLELDMPIICWESDMIWNGKNWDNFRNFEDENSDMNIYRRNTYRVLLTRGRDGFIIFIPLINKLDGVYSMLRKCGVRDLDLL